MKYIFPFILSLLLIACNEKNSIETEISKIPMEVKLTRFDQIFANAKVSDLPELKEKYAIFFPKQTPDSVWKSRFTDTIQLQLNEEVTKKFPDNTFLENELRATFQHFKYYFPRFKAPSVYTVTSDVDYQYKVIAADSLMIIALDTYLGGDHFFYEDISQYIAKNLKTSQIASDIVSEYARQLLAAPENRTLLAQMIYYGKALYMADKIIPTATDAEKIGYTEEEYAWAEENEVYMWQYFVEKEWLYNTSEKMRPRFINNAPFTKFGLQLDNESPGMLGRYLGWKIVRAYMEKHDEVTLEALLSKSSEEIFNKSKYKPKK